MGNEKAEKKGTSLRDYIIVGVLISLVALGALVSMKNDKEKEEVATNKLRWRVTKINGEKALVCRIHHDVDVKDVSGPIYREGWMIHAMSDIKKTKFVKELKGSIILIQWYAWKWDDYGKKTKVPSYWMILDTSKVAKVGDPNRIPDRLVSQYIEKTGNGLSPLLKS